jgi:hypothetical protein
VRTEESHLHLERKTVLQYQSAEWFEERLKRITASNFGRICKRTPHTGCQNLVLELLHRGEGEGNGRINEDDLSLHLEPFLK